MNARFLTINTVIRKYTIETTRDHFEMPYSSASDESTLHDEETITAFSEAV